MVSKLFANQPTRNSGAKYLLAWKRQHQETDPQAFEHDLILLQTLLTRFFGSGTTVQIFLSCALASERLSPCAYI